MTWNDIFDVKEQKLEYTSHLDATMVIQFDAKAAEDRESFHFCLVNQVVDEFANDFEIQIDSWCITLDYN